MATLITAISNSDTQISITPDSSFPTVDGVILIESEQIIYASYYMGTLYGCQRGSNSTSAASHSIGANVSLLNYFSTQTGEPGVFTTVTISGLTASTALTVNGSKVVTSSSTTSTELSYVHGVTSAIQTQLDAKELLVNKSTNTSLGTSDTLYPTQNAVKSYVDAHGLSYPLLAPDGSVSAPSYSFSGGTNTGLYFETAFGDVNIAVGGSNAINIQSSLVTTIAGQLIPSIGIFANDGNATTPQYSFGSNSLAGIYFDNATGTVGIASASNLGMPNDRKMFFGALDDTDFEIISNAGTTLDVKANNITALEVDKNNTADETKLLLWDISAGALVRVSRGAADSGGAGFRVLRIPN